MSAKFERLKAQFFAYASMPLMQQGFTTGLKTIMSAFLGYAVVGVPLLWIIYLAIVSSDGIEGSIIVIILASVFVTLAAGAIPALLLGLLTGTLQTYVLLRARGGIEKRRFVLFSLAAAALLMLLLNLIVWLTFVDFGDLAGLSFRQLLIEIFPILLALFFPG
ncbi:MAG: hypothetical protein JXB38_21620, partial [Anaerolineales bacterium]|nr:hypothetical protein [Anaerolineales bacterium]